jgi:hypothetical protein
MSTYPDPYVPPEGYQVPSSFGQYSQPVVPGAYDPLVPAPGSRFEGWWSMVMSTLRRGIVPLMLVFGLTMALPAIVLSIAGAATGAALALSPDLFVDERGVPAFDAGIFAGIAVAALVTIVITGFLSSLGWATGIHVILQTAGGGRAALGDAFRAGLARVLPMWGWYIVAGVMCIVGLVFCVLPGAYLAVALSMFSFVVIFERGNNPVSRSFQLVHSNFGAALGRVAMLFGIQFGVSFVVSCITGAGITAVSLAGDPSSLDPNAGLGVGVGAQVVSSIVSALVSLPLQSFILVGLMITYTQLRAAQEPVSTPHLMAAAQHQAPPLGWGPPQA